MATKKPKAEYITSRGGAANWDAYSEGMRGIYDSLSTAEEPAEQARGIFRGVADTGLALGRGAVQGVRMLTDLAGADNAVSGGLRSVEEFIGGLRSAQAKRDEQEIAAILKAAEGQGILEEVLAGLKAMAVAPVSQTASMAGTMIPTLMAGGGMGLAARALPKAAQAASVYGGMVGTGTAQGVGETKGQIYDSVLQAAKSAGKSDAEAMQLAAEAQSYTGPNAGQLATGGMMGALAGSPLPGSIEGLLAREVLKKSASKAPMSMPARVGVGAAMESIPEGLQEGQQQLAGNLAIQRAGLPMEDPWAGVVGSATMAAASALPLGAAGGFRAPQQATPTPDEVRSEKVPERGPFTRAQNAAVEEAAQKVEPAADQAAVAEMMAAEQMRAQAEPTIDVGGSAGHGSAGPDTPSVDPASARAQREADRPPEPTGDILPGDITTKAGKPFTSMPMAMRALQRAGGEATHELARVTGGLVIRPKTNLADQQDEVAAAPEPEAVVGRSEVDAAPDLAAAAPEDQPAEPVAPESGIEPELGMAQEVGGEARVVQVGGKEYTLTPEQATEWDRVGMDFKTKFDNAKAKYETRKKQAPTDNPDMGLRSAKEQYDAESKGLGMQLSAERRRIVGAQTAKEKAGAEKDAAKIRIGDRVQTPKGIGTVDGSAFGKVRVKLDAGATESFQRAQVQKSQDRAGPPAAGPADERAAPATSESVEKKPTLLDKMTEEAGGPLTFGDIKRIDAEQGAANEDESGIQTREAIGEWASGEYEQREKWLEAAGWHRGSEKFKQMLDKAWIAMTPGQQARIASAIKEWSKRRFDPPKPDAVDQQDAPPQAPVTALATTEGTETPAGGAPEETNKSLLADGEQAKSGDVDQAPKRPPKGFRKKVRVKTEVFNEGTGAFEIRDTDADTALESLDADISALEALLSCIQKG